MEKKTEARSRRKARIRTRVKGTEERPRLCVFRSAKHIYAQVVNDDTNKVLVTVGTVGKTNSELVSGVKKKEQATKIGSRVAELCKKKGIEKVVFDRSGYKYHGRVQALAKGARDGGLEF
ncbi:MAG: 50S ribosomal protein L18 [Pseudomonadota bacterium]